MALVLPYFSSYTTLFSALWSPHLNMSKNNSHTSICTPCLQWPPNSGPSRGKSGHSQEYGSTELCNLISMRPWKKAPGESLTLNLWSFCSMERDVTELVPKQDSLKKKEPRQGSCCLVWWAVLNRNNSAKRKIWISAILKIFSGIVNFMGQLRLSYWIIATFKSVNFG